MAAWVTSQDPGWTKIKLGSPKCGKPCESASAYRFHTRHTESCTFTQNSATRKQKKLLVRFRQEAAWEQHGKGLWRWRTWSGHGEESPQRSEAITGREDADESVSKCLLASCRRLRDSGNSFRQMGQLEAAPPPPAVPSPHLFTLTPCRIARPYSHTWFMAKIRHSHLRWWRWAGVLQTKPDDTGEKVNALRIT